MNDWKYDIFVDTLRLVVWCFKPVDSHLFSDFSHQSTLPRFSTTVARCHQTRERFASAINESDGTVIGVGFPGWYRHCASAVFFECSERWNLTFVWGLNLRSVNNRDDTVWEVGPTSMARSKVQHGSIWLKCCCQRTVCGMSWSPKRSLVDDDCLLLLDVERLFLVPRERTLLLS